MNYCWKAETKSLAEPTPMIVHPTYMQFTNCNNYAVLPKLVQLRWTQNRHLGGRPFMKVLQELKNSSLFKQAGMLYLIQLSPVCYYSIIFYINISQFSFMFRLAVGYPHICVPFCIIRCLRLQHILLSCWLLL